MIGRVVDISTNGVNLSVKRGFMLVSTSAVELGRIPLDDIGAVIVHAHGATYSANLTARLAERGIPMVICGSNHAPIAVIWPLDGHYEQGRRMEAQADASQPLRKRLWRDLVKGKVKAQADALEILGKRSGALRDLAKKVRSGDPDNIEAQAARRYWPVMMGEDFRRDRDGGGVNTLLNYGYTVLRAATARSILAAGLHPSLSLHHRSRGTALRLADDLMEPFRPYVDLTVCRLRSGGVEVLDKEAKSALAAVTTIDLEGPQGVSPLQVCLNRLAGCLAQIFLGERDVLDLPGPPLPLLGATRRT